MGRRDIKGRETKKPKKDAKKASKASILLPQPEVQVIKVKGKKEEEKW